jgi:arylsulfatase A
VAVRSGEWKLVVAWPGGRPLSGNKADIANEPMPQLFNLDKDIGETTNVATANPDIVKRLLGLIDEMGKDLGVKENGPGVREPGRIAEPKGLFM